MAFVTTLVVGIPIEVISLLLNLVQTIVAIFNWMKIEEAYDMMNSMLVDSGTHGVVRILWG